MESQGMEHLKQSQVERSTVDAGPQADQQAAPSRSETC